MRMEVHIYSSIKAIVATDKLKDIVTTQNSQSLSMRIHPKGCRIFPLKVETILLGGSRKGAIGA